MLGNGIKGFYKGKDVLVTGGTGSVGSEIVRQLLNFDVKRVRIFDSSEPQMFALSSQLKNNKIRELIGDVRDKERLKLAMKDVDIVFHCAALKHVPMCEYNPFEAVKTNVLGTQNVIEAAREEGVDRLISISTDKAVSPINTMGATKLLGEKLVLNAAIGDLKTKFSCVRFGNVLNSSGSVIPIFRSQIETGGPVTLTSEEMTRFFMSMRDAVGLVIRCTSKMEGHEIFILKMDSVRIKDLAEVMVEELSPRYGFDPKKIEIRTIGVRPGEKIHESLLTEEESYFVQDSDDMLILRPGINIPHYVEKTSSGHAKIDKVNSKDVKILSKDQILSVLMRENIL